MTTTIKVSDQVRDRLKKQASADGRTLGEQIEYLLELGDRSARFETLRAEIKATPADQLASYHEELNEWATVDR
ncbi:MAG: hypothetical protein QM774_11835 [Gordonia sp. (in: high G+C Gram-positive bacteria)]|uniref:hypothetical protein n=1 Tax=Gordonia sp. (in: high G+C Gram-positive bacteria) TaxID=84139 RepID=UPI0039E50FF9